MLRKQKITVKIAAWAAALTAVLCFSVPAQAAEIPTVTSVRTAVRDQNFDFEYRYPQIIIRYNPNNIRDANISMKEYAELQMVKAKVLWREQPGISVLGNVQYEITRNSGPFISVKFLSFLDTGGAHPETTAKGFTIHTETGRVCHFTDLFINGIQAKHTIDRFVKQEMDNRGLNEKLLHEYDGITHNSPFYLTDTHLVLYFNPYEYFPYSEGIVEIQIPYSAVSELLADGVIPNV